MKKLLIGSITFLAFSLINLLFSYGCKKTILPPGSHGIIPQVGKVLLDDSTEGVYSIMNYDGSDKHTIPIPMTQSQGFGNVPLDGKLSPDGKILYFAMWDFDSWKERIYSCNIDGTDLKLLSNVNKRADVVCDVK
jgi:hypothetical protein